MYRSDNMTKFEEIPQESTRFTNNTKLYIIIVFAISFVYQIIIYFNGGVDSPLIPLLIFVPGIIALLFIQWKKEGFKEIGWGLGNWIYLPLAVYILLICTGFLIMVFQGLGLATLTVFKMENGLVTSRVPMLLGNHPQSLPFFAFNLAISFVQISLIGAFFALGEEIGWRGYLQGKMIKEQGMIKALILLGLIWGYWHLPLILRGLSFPNIPVLGGFLIYPISTVFMALYHGWIYLKSSSIWVPTLSHGAFNIAGGIIFSGMELHVDILIIQLIWIAMLGLLAIPCYISLKK